MTRPSETSGAMWNEIDWDEKVWTIPAERLVSHSLRSLTSTTLNEQGVDRDLIEAALAHSDDSQVRSAYNRTDYLKRRRPMMYWWSRHIEDACKSKLSISGTLSLKSVI